MKAEGHGGRGRGRGHEKAPSDRPADAQAGEGRNGRGRGRENVPWDRSADTATGDARDGRKGHGVRGTRMREKGVPSAAACGVRGTRIYEKGVPSAAACGVRMRVTGLGTARLISTALARDISIANARRTGARTMECDIPARQREAFEALCRARGFGVIMLRELGLMRVMRALLRRWGLAAGAVLLAIGVFSATRLVWAISITGDDVYIGEVRTFLAEHDIRAGMPKSQVDTQALENALARRLPTVAWAYVRMDGVTLSVRLVPGVPAPGSQVQGTGDLVAERDGIVLSVYTLRGTPVCKPGDLVRAGQVLIRGEERSADETTVPVRARGVVNARVWIAASARVSRLVCISEATGRVYTRTLAATPFYAFTLAPDCAFAAFDRESETLALGGAFFPAQLVRETYHEVRLVYALRGAEETRAEAAEAALLAAQAALAKQLPSVDETVDKWVDYCMIGNEAVEARATLECTANIAVSEPIHFE